MLILGIETATERVSVAVGGHEGVIGLFEVTKGRRHVETLVPAIDYCPRHLPSSFLRGQIFFESDRIISHLHFIHSPSFGGLIILPKSNHLFRSR